jgi:hypothetical protein
VFEAGCLTPLKKSKSLNQKILKSAHRIWSHLFIMQRSSIWVEQLLVFRGNRISALAPSS